MHINTSAPVGVLGASGYVGRELLRLLAGHPGTTIAFATAENAAGEDLDGIRLVRADDAPLASAEVVFSCLPHGVSGRYVHAVRAAGRRAVDLSADFRLKDPAAYPQWYGAEHTAPELLDEFAYGLPELFRDELVGASGVAVPGESSRHSACRNRGAGILACQWRQTGMSAPRFETGSSYCNCPVG